MRAPLINASFSRAWSFGIRSQASSKRRCSSVERTRVRRFWTLNLFTLLAGESTRYFHSMAFDRIDFNVSSSRLTVAGFTVVNRGSGARTQRTPSAAAPKSRTFHGREWMEHARERWAELTNATPERCGRRERVDHRSYERQGIDREPGEHFGPGAAHVIARGQSHDRLEAAATLADDQEALRAIEAEIARLEVAREGLMLEVSDRDEPASGRRFSPDRSEPDHSADLIQER